MNSYNLSQLVNTTHRPASRHSRCRSVSFGFAWQNLRHVRASSRNDGSSSEAGKKRGKNEKTRKVSFSASYASLSRGVAAVPLGHVVKQLHLVRAQRLSSARTLPDKKKCTVLPKKINITEILCLLLTTTSFTKSPESHSLC